MIVRFITVKVAEGLGPAFEEVTKENRGKSLTEPGILRFDVLKDSEDSNTYYLYEVYASQDATSAHKETEHYKKWKESVADMMASPRTSVACRPISPKDRNGWVSEDKPS